MRKCSLWIAAAAALVGGPALATENGTQHYPVGVNTVADGNLPPPGMLQLLNYFQVSPNPVTTNGAGGKALPDFDLDIEANAARLLYTWKFQVGPFHYTTGLVQPIVNLDIDVAGEKGQDLSFGDTDLQNYLGYVSPDHKLFYYFGLDLYMPTGNYSRQHLVNTGENYYTIAPNINVTYNPSPRWELTATAFSEFNTTNTATRYHSGDDVDVDYGVTYRPLQSLPHFGLGLNGYFYKQISDDTIADLTAPGKGDRGQEFAFGPQFRYDIPFGGFVLKWQHEYDVKNRPRGDRIWLQFAVPLLGTPKD